MGKVLNRQGPQWAKSLMGKVLMGKVLNGQGLNGQSP